MTELDSTNITVTQDEKGESTFIKKSEISKDKFIYVLQENS